MLSSRFRLSCAFVLQYVYANRTSVFRLFKVLLQNSFKMPPEEIKYGSGGSAKYACIRLL